MSSCRQPRILHIPRYTSAQDTKTKNMVLILLLDGHVIRNLKHFALSNTVSLG